MLNNQIYFDQEKFTNDVINILQAKKASELDEEDSDDDYDPVFAGGDSGKRSGEFDTEKKARDLLERKDIRQFMCPFLKSCSNDVFDIAKAMITPLTLTVLAGKLAFPLDPTISAAFFFLVAKAGIAGYCKEFE